jgi:hypothetical protein
VTTVGAPAIDAELQADVDAQLLERGAFTALEWLIESGRLSGADYEDWRRGELGWLDAALMGSKDEVRSQLQSVARYARRIGLVERQQEFDAWGADGGAARRGLRASNDPALHDLMASRYTPAADGPQMDLFFDNPVVAIVNGLVRALSGRDLAASRRQLDRLYERAPTHADLAGFDRLLACLERLPEPVLELRAEIGALAELGSTARRLLGFQARDLLIPAWRRIAHATAGQAYDATADELHASFALAAAGDWSEACDSVLGEPQWTRHAALCVRLATSAYHGRRRGLRLSAWMHLCWRAPQAAPAALEARDNPDAGILALWQRFLECAESVSLERESNGEVELGSAEFPAWLLLHEPGLVLQIPASLPTGATAAERLFRLVHDWVQARRGRPPSEEIALRAAVRAASPGLFRVLKYGIDGSSQPACDRRE